jgi:HSF-type DNA-binding
MRCVNHYLHRLTIQTSEKLVTENTNTPQSISMSIANAMIRDTLRQSINDVLSELDADMAAPSSFVRQTSSQRTQNGLASPMASFGLVSHGSRTLAMSSSTIRPSAALGITSEQLMLAAATERRMMEERKIMMEYERARAVVAARQRVLQSVVQERNQQKQSLLGLFRQSSSLGLPSNLFGSFAVKVQASPQAPVKQPQETLKELGTCLRQKSSPYIDVADAADPDPTDSRVKKTRGGVTEPFPERLHRLLLEIAKDGNGDVVSFLPHGRAFAIHKTDRFVSEIMPAYFKQKSLSSFQRQLNLYGFKRVVNGRDAGAYYHELFLQGKPNMCLIMRRVGLPKGDDRRKMRSKNVQVDPDFYCMNPVVAPRPSSAS